MLDDAWSIGGLICGILMLALWVWVDMTHTEVQHCVETNAGVVQCQTYSVPVDSLVEE